MVLGDGIARASLGRADLILLTGLRGFLQAVAGRRVGVLELIRGLVYFLDEFAGLIGESGLLGGDIIEFVAGGLGKRLRILTDGLRGEFTRLLIEFVLLFFDFVKFVGGRLRKSSKEALPRLSRSRSMVAMAFDCWALALEADSAVCFACSLAAASFGVWFTADSRALLSALAAAGMLLRATSFMPAATSVESFPRSFWDMLFCARSSPICSTRCWMALAEAACPLCCWARSASCDFCCGVCLYDA